MKIVEMTFSLWSGGAERFTVDLCNELSKSNDVTLITLKDDKIDTERRCFYKFDLSERVNYLNLGLGQGFSLESETKIYTTLRKLNPNIVHLNGGNLPKFCALAMLLLCHKMKFIQTIHNDLKNGYDKGFNKHLYKTVGNSKRFSCVALSEKNYLDFKKYYPNLNIECIVNGRAALKKTDKFESVKRELGGFRKDAQTKLFLHVARFHSQKNQGLLIAAFNKICTSHNVSLVIIGNGFDTPKGQELKNKACDKIHFLGTRKNVADYFLNSDIFTLSSIFEGMPISLIEASLAGLPCVSTPVCGAVDLIVDGVNGKLSSDFSEESYIAALEYSLLHFDELKRNAEEMKKKSPYTMEECAKKYLQVFER